MRLPLRVPMEELGVCGAAKGICVRESLVRASRSSINTTLAHIAIHMASHAASGAATRTPRRTRRCRDRDCRSARPAPEPIPNNIRPPLFLILGRVSTDAHATPIAAGFGHFEVDFAIVRAGRAPATADSVTREHVVFFDLFREPIRRRTGTRPTAWSGASSRTGCDAVAVASREAAVGMVRVRPSRLERRRATGTARTHARDGDGSGAREAKQGRFARDFGLVAGRLGSQLGQDAQV